SKSSVLNSASANLFASTYNAHRSGGSRDDAILLVDSDDEGVDIQKSEQVVIEVSDGEEEEESEEEIEIEVCELQDARNLPDKDGRVLISPSQDIGIDPEIELAPQISRVIKPHQVSGIRFLYENLVESLSRFQSSQGFGCILAHSMGLGKTIQIIGFLELLFRQCQAKSNWQAEFELWLPVYDAAAAGSCRSKVAEFLASCSSLKLTCQAIHRTNIEGIPVGASQLLDDSSGLVEGDLASDGNSHESKSNESVLTCHRIDHASNGMQGNSSQMIGGDHQVLTDADSSEVPCLEHLGTDELADRAKVSLDSTNNDSDIRCLHSQQTAEISNAPLALTKFKEDQQSVTPELEMLSIEKPTTQIFSSQYKTVGPESASTIGAASSVLSQPYQPPKPTKVAKLDVPLGYRPFKLHVVRDIVKTMNARHSVCLC
ncbi:unnamed protein product, partial [Protopolystoma xenopodis]